MIASFKSAHGHWLRADIDNVRVDAGGIGEGPWEEFTLEPAPGGTVFLRSCHGRYLSAELDGRVTMKTTPDVWERWMPVPVSDGTGGLRSFHGKFLCADAPSGFVWGVVANRDQCGPWEKWGSSLFATPAPVLVPPTLAVSGTSFVDRVTSQRWMWRGTTAFHMLQHWMDGDKGSVTTFVAWMRANGINLARTTSMYDGGLGRFIPADYPAYWHQMDEFLAWMGGQGLAVELTIFCDAQTDRLKLIDQSAHYANVRDVVAKHRHVAIEIANEPWKNGVDVGVLKMRDSRVIQATGASDDAGRYDYPALDYITLHDPRDDEWPRKAKNLQEHSAAMHRPCVGDEPYGIGRILPGGSPSRSLIAADHAQYHALAALFGAGSTIHGNWGIAELRPPTSEEQVVVDAVTSSWIIPAEVHETWSYTRGGFTDCPLVDNGLRTYAMVSPNGLRAWAVRVRPTTTPHPADGWRLVAEHGYQGCVVECERT